MRHKLLDFFKRMYKESFISLWVENIRQTKRFKRIVRNELDDPMSIFQTYNIKASEDYKTLTLQWTLDKQWAYVPENERYIKFINDIRLFNDYLSYTLDFGEYLYAQGYGFQDENEDNIYLAYGMKYSFVPKEPNKKQTKQMIWTTIGAVALIAVIILISVL